MSSEKEMPDIHLQLCYAYTSNNRVLYHAKQANIIAKKLGDSLNIVKSGRLVGWSYRRLNHLDSSINACKQVLGIAKRNKYMFEYGRLLNGLGMTYTFIAKYDEALKCHFESLAAMESIDIENGFLYHFSTLVWCIIKCMIMKEHWIIVYGH